jgi:hypothetical protein
MEFWKTILGLARERFIGPPVLVLALGLAAAGFFLLPERYVTSVSMVVVAPSGGGSVDRTKPLAQTNPLLEFSDDLRTTASILILAMNSPDVFRSVGVTENGSTDLTVDDGRSNPQLIGVGTTGPFIYVQVESGSPGEASRVLKATQGRLRAELDRRQTELRAHPVTFAQIKDVVLLAPEADGSARLQGAAGGLLLGLVVGLGTAYAVVGRRQVAVPAQRVSEERSDQPLSEERSAQPGPEERSQDAEDEPDPGPEPEEPPPARPSNGTGPVLGDADATGPIDIVRMSNGR